MKNEFDIAITVDDLPSHGTTVNQFDRLTIAKNFVELFCTSKLPPITGFANFGLLEKDKKNEEIIKGWIMSGNFLGNHTYSHFDLREINQFDFIADIEKNERAMRRHVGMSKYKFFRYPYLLEGDTKEKLNYIKEYLQKNNYKVAPVTIDFLDFLWNDPVCKCLSRGDNHGITFLKEVYVATAIQKIISSRDISIRIFGRNIKQVMLIHIGIASMFFLKK